MEAVNKQLIVSKIFQMNPLAPYLLSKYEQWKTHRTRIITSPKYNTFFDYKTGEFIRCGATVEEDPDFAELGPEILDMEISTICHGIAKDGLKATPCAFCYKSNTGKGKNMSFERFKTIFDKMPPNLTQIAFGIGDLDGNPDLEKILNYCSIKVNGKKEIVPNITINGDRLTDDFAMLLHDCCGAVAVSHYDDDVCFDAVKKLTELGMEQINIHHMISEETFDSAMHLLHAAKTDPRLEKLNAIVFLSLKTKGRGKSFKPLLQARFTQLVEFALANNVSIGFDSCSTFKFFTAVEDHKDYNQFRVLAEPCESTLFSSYINVDGKFFPCSFAEGSMDEWQDKDGIDVVNCKDFIEDVWYHPKTVEFREKLLHTATCNSLDCRTCPIYKV